MGFFTTRERAELGRPLEPEPEGKVRELARRDYSPRRRPPDSDLVAENVGSLLARVTETSLTEIDGLIADLQTQREKLMGESARVQRAIMEYAKLSQSTMQSTRIITESLNYWNKVPESSGAAEPAPAVVKKKSLRNAEQRPTYHSENDGSAGQAEPSEVSDGNSSRLETSRSRAGSEPS